MRDYKFEDVFFHHIFMKDNNLLVNIYKATDEVKLVYASQAICQHLELSIEELLIKKPNEYSRFSHKYFTPAHKKLLEDGHLIVIKDELISSSGKCIPVEFSLSRFGYNNELFYICHGRLITPNSPLSNDPFNADESPQNED